MAKRLNMLKRMLSYGLGLIALASPLKAQTTFTGTVRHGNNPVPNMIVSVNQSSDTTGLDGRYFIKDFSTGVEELAQNNSIPDDFRLKLYPNPVERDAVIESDAPANSRGRLTIVNVLGQRYPALDVDGGANSALLNLNLPAGVYLYKIDYPEFSLSGKFIALGNNTNLDLRLNRLSNDQIKRIKDKRKSGSLRKPGQASLQVRALPGSMQSQMYSDYTTTAGDVDLTPVFNGRMFNGYVFLVDSTKLFDTRRPEGLENLIAYVESGNGFSIGKVMANDLVFINAGNDTSYHPFNAQVPEVNTFVMKRARFSAPVPAGNLQGKIVVTDSLRNWTNSEREVNSDEDLFVYQIGRENPNTTSFSAFNVFRMLSQTDPEDLLYHSDHISRMPWRWEVLALNIPADTNQTLPYKVFRKDSSDSLVGQTSTSLPHTIALYTRKATDEITLVTGTPIFEGHRLPASGLPRDNISLQYYDLGSHVGETTFLGNVIYFNYKGRELQVITGAVVRLDNSLTTEEDVKAVYKHEGGGHVFFGTGKHIGNRNRLMSSTGILLDYTEPERVAVIYEHKTPIKWNLSSSNTTIQNVNYVYKK